MSEAELHFSGPACAAGSSTKARRGELHHAAAGRPGLRRRRACRPRPRPGVQQAPVTCSPRSPAPARPAPCVKAFRDEGCCSLRIRTGPRNGELGWMPLATTGCCGSCTTRAMPARSATAAAATPPARRARDLPGAAPRAVDRADPRRPPRIHHLGPVRGQPGPPGRQRRRPRPRPARRAAPGGPALLQGLVICGRCGARMTVRYHSRERASKSPITSASGTASTTPAPSARPIPGAAADAAIGQLLLDTLTPLALEVALTVQAELEDRAADADALRRRPRRARPPPRRPGPPPLPRRRPRQPARRDQPRSRLEHRAARLANRPRTTTTTPRPPPPR